jgi:MFS family permease
MLLSSLGTSIANVALPTLSVAFSASFQEVQWIVLVYLLAITTLIVSVGRLGDVVGRRRLMLIGLGLFTFASALCGAASTLWLLIAARAVQGVAAEAVPKEKAGSAMGLLGTMSAIGTALGPSVGGLLIAGFGWPSIFFISVPLGLLALLLAFQSLPMDLPAPASTSTRRAPFDVLGTLVLGSTLGSYALALTAGRGHYGWLNGALLLAAAAGAALFVRVEALSASPLIAVARLREPLINAGLAMSGLVSTVVMASLVVGPFYLSGALGLHAAGVGLVMSSGPLVAALSGLPAGRMVDRFGARRVTLAGLIGMALGTSLLAMMPARFGVPGYVMPLLLVTAGYAFFQAANNTSIMANAIGDQRGVTSGMLNLSRNLGLITGASVMGAVFAVTSGASGAGGAGAPRPDAVAIGMRSTFALAAALVFTAIALARRSDNIAQRAVTAGQRTE